MPASNVSLNFIFLRTWEASHAVVQRALQCGWRLSYRELSTKVPVDEMGVWVGQGGRLAALPAQAVH